MTTTLTAATLTLTITESISLNGKEQGGTNSVSIASIAEVNKRIVSVPTGEKVLLSFAAAAAAGTFIPGDVRYVRLTNKDDTNFCIVTVEGDNSTDYTQRLDPGCSHIFISSSSTGVADYADIVNVTLEDFSAINATANTAACDVEVLVASV